VGLFPIFALQSNEIPKKNKENLTVLPLPGNENGSMQYTGMDRPFTNLYLVPFTSCGGHHATEAASLRVRDFPYPVLTKPFF
jgi:hypothetical protein